MHMLSGGSGNDSYHRVVETVKHPDFNRGTLENDIALLRVESPFTFTADVRAICPPEVDNLYVDEEAVVSGWGYTGGKSLHRNRS